MHRAQAPPDRSLSRLKKVKAPTIVPEAQIQIGDEPAGARSGRSRPRQAASTSLQTQRAGAPRGNNQIDDAHFKNHYLEQSYRGSEASTVHRPEAPRGDYSFRSNMDLFNQEQSRVLADQSYAADGEDPKNMKAQMA